MRLIILCLMLAICLSVKGQVNPMKLTSARMESGKWIKLEKSLRKSLAKDTLNPEARYLMSLFYFNSGYSTFNIDSSYQYALGSRRNYKQSSLQIRERLKKVPLDSIVLVRLKDKIDSAAFERSKRTNTLQGYQYFINHYSTARQQPVAIELRDEVAFLEALKVNTWASFQKFMTQYPASHRREEAQNRFDKLLYEDKTKDQRLTSFIRFHQQYAASPYRSLAEKSIFEMSTTSGAVKSFQWFIENYPSGKWARRAKNILYGLRATEGNEIFKENWFTDSLRQTERLNQNYWVPVFKSGLYGFMDEHGAEIIAPQFENIPEDYLCGNLVDKFLVTSKGLIGRNESRLWPGKVNTARDLGLGFIEVESDSGKYVLHESGFRLGTSPAENTKLLANRFIGLERNKKWSVFCLTGKSIVPFSYDELDAFDTLIIFTRNGKKILTTPARLTRSDEKDSKDSFVFDEVRRWGSQQFWVRNGQLEGVMDANLNFIIPLDRQILRKTIFGFLREKEKRLYVQGISRLENKPFFSVFEQGNWVRLRVPAGGYLLYEKTFDQLVEGDSAWFQGQIAFMLAGDSVSAFLPAGQKLSFHEKSLFRLMEYKDSTAWIVLDEKKKKTVFDAASGLKLFTSEFDQIEPVSTKIFLVIRANKKGLIREDGQVLVPLEYDAIVVAGDHAFSLLKDKKFGWYDAQTKQLMKPVYDRNVKSYNDHFLLAFKEKGYAFIRPDGTPLGNFEWEDFQYWNDSVAWVKKNFQWMLLTIHSQKIKLDRVRSFSTILDSPAEKIYSVRQDNATGVISNRKGILVPIQYSDIINLGTSDVPLYFTERHIEEAGISVVVYFDRNGKIVRKQAMETEEFEKIVCDN